MVLLKRDGHKTFSFLIEKRDLENSRFNGTPLNLLSSIIKLRVKGVQKIEITSGLMIVTMKPLDRGPIACEHRIQAALEC